MSVHEDITCREIVETVTDYLEGALTSDERETVELHFVLCDGCDNYLEQMRTAIRLTGQLTEDSLSPEVQEALIQAFTDLRRE